jgi:hypothetical protein
MKTLMLFFLLGGGVLSSLTLSAQKIKLKGLPHNTGHYLIIENAEDFSNFSITVFKTNITGEKQPVDKARLVGERYFYLKPEYFDASNGSFEVNIQGFNNSGTLSDDISVPCAADDPNVNDYYQWKCVSPTYAFGLTASYEDTNDSFWLDELNTEYVWWSNNEYPIALNGYGLIESSSDFTMIPGAIEGLLHNNPMEIKYNVFGGQWPASSSTFLKGLPKKLLPQWENKQGELGNANADNHFTCIMADMSDYPFNIPSAYYSCVGNAVTYANILEADLDLVCGGMLKPYNYQGDANDWTFNHSGRPGWWGDFVDSVWDNFIGNNGLYDPTDNNHTDIWDMLLVALDKAEEDGVIPTNTISEFAAVRFDNLSTKEFHYFDSQDFMEAGSNRNTLAFTLSPGIYQARIILSTGEMRSIYFATNEKIQNSIEMKDLVSITAFPNPIIGDNYSLLINSSVDVTVNYEVLNLQGISLHKERLIIKGNNVATPKITLPQGVPSGTIIHRFSYPDGSWESLLTTK